MLLMQTVPSSVTTQNLPSSTLVGVKLYLAVSPAQIVPVVHWHELRPVVSPQNMPSYDSGASCTQWHHQHKLWPVESLAQFVPAVSLVQFTLSSLTSTNHAQQSHWCKPRCRWENWWIPELTNL